MTPMRILQVVQKPQRRGAEVFALQLSAALRRLGQEVATAYLYPHQGPGALALGDGDLLLEGRESHPFERVPGVHPGLLRRLRRAIAEFRPDVVQLNGARTVKYGAYCRTNRGSRDFALVYRNIGSPRRWVRGGLRRWFYRRRVMPRIDGVVAVSRATLAELESFYGLTVPAQVIPNGVRVDAGGRGRNRRDFRESAGTPAEAPVLLYVGSLSAEKRLDRWLRVARRVRAEVPDLVLWLVGEGPEAALVEARAAELGLGGALRLLGARDDVTDAYRAADLFLLTSESEGMPAAVLEAGVHGVPVVAFRVGGLAECVVDGKTGVLVEPGDVDACAEAIVGLLRDTDRRARMGAMAREFCAAEFGIETVARRYLSFYRRVRDESFHSP